MDYKQLNLRCDVITRSLFRIFIRHIRDDFNTFVSLKYAKSSLASLNPAINAYLLDKYAFEVYSSKKLTAIKVELKLILGENALKFPAQHRKWYLLIILYHRTPRRIL
jgi:hypothetical protein